MQITVQKIWPREDGKDSGGFKGTDGANYYCDTTAHSLLNEGMSFEADAKKMQSRASGKTYYQMPKGWKPNGVAGLLNGGDGYQASQGLPPAPSPAYAPQVQPNGVGAAPRPASNGYVLPSTPQQMFVMGVVGRAMGSGKFGADDIELLTIKAADAWDKLG